MALHNWIPRSARRVHRWRLQGGMRSVRALGPVALTLVLIVVAAVLLASIQHPRVSSGGTGGTGQLGAASLLVARADVHVEGVLNGKDLELNLAITQTANDCQEALNGGVCLRYSVVLDEQPILVGHGVVPRANVNVTATSIQLKADTSKIPNFVHVAGPGCPIIVTWKALPTVARSGTPLKATVLGGIAKYTIPSSGVIASVVFR